MPKISLTREELKLVIHVLDIDIGGGDLGNALEFLVTQGAICPGKVDADRLMAKFEAAQEPQ